MDNRNILIVDDEKNIRLTMKKALEPLDFPTHTAVNGEEALQKMREMPFWLVFLDLKMPGMDGIQVLEVIRERNPETNVVIITAHGTVDSAVDAMKAGALDFIQKPFTPTEVRDVVTEIANRAETDQSAETDYDALIRLAKRKISENSYGEAAQVSRKAMKAEPDEPEAYNLLGGMYELKGNWQNAQKFYRMALDLDPTYEPARENLERTTSWDKSGEINLGKDETYLKPQKEDTGE